MILDGGVLFNAFAEFNQNIHLKPPDLHTSNPGQVVGNKFVNFLTLASKFYEKTKYFLIVFFLKFIIK